MGKKALIILADGFEEIEAISCIDTLRRAEIEVVVAGLDKLLIVGSRGIKVEAEVKLDAVKDLPDAIILPGGSKGAENLAASQKVAGLIKDCFKQGKIVAAICAAPAFVLYPTGILKGKRFTCFPGCEVRIQDAAYVKDAVVIDGNIITSQGPATAIEFALAIVAKLVGKEKADDVGKRMLVR